MDIKQIVREEVEKYAAGGKGEGLRLFPVLDDERAVYTVNAVSYPDRTDYDGVVVMARLMDDYIVIEVDHTNKPLINALQNRGLSSEQIILAYQGDKVPE
ncbi:MAG: element excision factor XisI family protein [Aggregatilineales bacterium]